MNPKEQLYRFCQAFVSERITRLEKAIENLQESLDSETKSTAGDKHETGRAMVQLEREKIGKQLAEAEKMKQLLARVPWEHGSATVALGSWVQTSEDNYFLAISAGEAIIDGTATYCISLATPMGRLLLGKSEGDSVTFRSKKITIRHIS